MFLSINELRELAALMSGRLHVDYTGYNLSFFARRLQHVFKKMGLRRAQDLKSALGSLPKDDEVNYYMTVPSTELFRAPSFWRQLIKLLSERDIKNIWVPSLSSYHELYSLMIVLDIVGKHDVAVDVNVLSDHIAADIRSLALSKNDIELDKSNFERLQTQHSFDEYACQSENGSLLRSGLIDHAVITNGWFMNTDEKKYDLILFRNTLIEYKRPLHVKAVERIMSSLRGRGSVLCLGTMERLLTSEDWFDSELAFDGIYVRK